MRDLTFDDRRLCELQALVFEKSLLASPDGSATFVRRYMRSELARRLDDTGFVLEFSDPIQMVREVDDEYGNKAYGSERFDAEEMHWMGYIYRCWCCMTGESSKVVHRAIGARELRSLFAGYHTMDPVRAVERMREARGIEDVDEIELGVRILKRLRERDGTGLPHAVAE
jgi:hypothetical protein